MKKITLIAVALIIIGTSCKKDKSPNPTGSPVTSGSLTPWENSLAGQWLLKRVEVRGNLFYQGLNDSTEWYTNHYNLINSQLNLTSTPSCILNGIQYYSATFGNDDSYAPGNNYIWAGGTNNTFALGVNVYMKVIYLSTDSLVVDWMGTQERYFFNKTIIAPSLNNIESQLIGGIWTHSAQTGLIHSYIPYKMFNSNWYDSEGYYGKDSTSALAVNVDQWEVLFSNRQIPILRIHNTGGYYKITNLTPNSLTIEHMNNPQVNSTTDYTDTYSR